MVTIFFAYSHRDEQLRDELEIHLTMLKREGIIGLWHDRRIGPGEHIDKVISQELEDSQIILLLVSAYFLSSDYCYEIELDRAMQKHHAGSARVIPVILRPCDWHTAPFGKLRAVPKDGKPVTKYADQHDAFLEIAQAVREAAANLRVKPRAATRSAVAKQSRAAVKSPPRSSNLRIKKHFSDRDKDTFLKEAFEYMANFFEGSLEELRARNTGVDTDFTRIDAFHFSAHTYVHGEAKSQCRIWLGRGSFPNGIALALGGSLNDSSYNESLSVENDGYSLFLRPMGIAFRRPSESEQLTQQGAAEYYWSLFIEPLQ